MNPYYQDDYITIYHGNCEDILQLLPPVDSLITDPPYGVNFDTDYTRFSGGVKISRNAYQPIANDAKPFDPSHLLGFRRVVLWGANCYPLPMGSMLVWDKRTENGNKNCLSDAEIAWMNTGHGIYIFQHTWDGFNRASERGTKYHPSQKPVAVLRWIIGKAKPQGLICDPCAGSGSTLLAAKELGFKSIGIELDEQYCEIAAKRAGQTGVMFPLEISNDKVELEQLDLFEDCSK